MKTLILFLMAFVISAFPQNYKKVKILINNEFDLNKAVQLSVDLEEAHHDKNDNISLFEFVVIMFYVLARMNMYSQM